MNAARPQRPATRAAFEIAVICALPIEADAVDALFDHHWDDDGPPYDKAAGDPNAYSTGAIGRHNVVLAHMPGMGKASAAAVAAHCRASFPNIKLALIVGVCGVVPFRPGSSETAETVLGDVIVSESVVQYDLGQRLPEQFVTKDTLLDALGRPNTEIRTQLAKLKGLRGRKMLQSKMAGYMDVLRREPELAAAYPGAAQDRLFEATYRHVSDGKSCEECACEGKLVRRTRLEQGDGQPAVHFGLIASGDTVMKSGEDRDDIARKAGIIGFEMEGAGVWDIFPCVVIKGACDYADSHKNKGWQRYAAATAAACMKAFLDHWVPSLPESLPPPEQPTGPWFLVPYTENTTFIGRESILKQLQQQLLRHASQSRIALFGLGGVGKTQIALAYTYWLRRTRPEVSVFWVHASNAERFRQAYASIAQECQVPGYDDPKADVLLLVKAWLERTDRGQWLMVIDNADDTQLFFGQQMVPANTSSSSHEESLGRYLPDCRHGAILVTTRNKQAGSRLTKGKRPIEVMKMDEDEADQLLRAHLDGISVASSESFALSSRLEHLPLALVQAVAFIQENTIAVGKYLELLDNSDQDLVALLSEEFETNGRDSETPRAVAETWILSFEQIQRQNAFAGELLSLMSLFDRQAVPLEFLSRYSEQQGQEQRGEMQLTKALGVLKAFSFVTEDQSHGFDMHRLVQLVTQRWLARKGTIRQFGEQALLVASQAFPYGSYENRAICSTFLPHVYAVLRLESTGSKDERLARASLLHCAGGFFSYQGQWNDAEKFRLQARGLRTEVLGEEHPDTLTSMADLASTYRNQGRWKEAESLEVQVMETSLRVLEEEHPDTLTRMGNLASTFWNQGRWKEAELLFVQVMETFKRVLGEEHPNTLTSMANLASTYWNQGRWKEAELLEVQVMETSLRLLGEEHPDTLTSMANLASTMANLASTYWNQGRWKEAEELQAEELNICSRVLGEEHPNTLNSMANLAHTWNSQDRLEDALNLMKTCFHHQQQVLGRDHPDTVSTLSILTEWQERKSNTGA
ncbi:kinesin light chain 3 [Corynascus novoguineensis]|uniref:Kinesin light chain 3 n=1 Tax=Corynascus novoguineensis TaxID=1126955 RepID=A0AAN7CLW0_9PEZI|nr:kinesin light chain 3 [Corynascus novoguineensis]